MTTNRTRIIKPLIDTREDAETCLGELATLTLERRDLQNALDREITAAREKYESSLSAIGEQIETKQALLHGWADSHPEEFASRKSLELTHGQIGYRTGQHKLKSLKRKTWDAILKSLQTFGFTHLIRTKEEVDKEAIIAGYKAAEISRAEMIQIGVEVVQDEAFFVEVKLAEQANREVVAA